MSQATTNALQQVLVDSYAMAIKLQNYHWNVEGRHFKQLHELFEEQYNEVFGVIDEIAERIRTLGAKVPASFKNYSASQSIKDGDENLDENAMVQDIYASHQAVIDTAKAALKAASEVDDEPSVDMMIGRIAAHEKAMWMLRSSLPEAMRAELPKAAA
ncbi:MAG: DNA starvation/stationary phase protection protein [Rickettsiales bacterium]|nr:DNA starvation/stationary phase protection protein [Rickettsiales bacterium]